MINDKIIVAIIVTLTGILGVIALSSGADIEILDAIPRDIRSITLDGDAASAAVVDEIIAMYDSDKEGTLEYINNLNSKDPSYPFVIDAETGIIVAHGSDADLASTESLIPQDRAHKSYAVILDELIERSADTNEYRGVWAEYVFLNPELGQDQLKRSWLVLHDGYIFGSGHYYSPEARAQQEVSYAIELYDELGKDAFKRINTLSLQPYSFYAVVIDVDTSKVVAHGAFPYENVGVKVTQSLEGLNDLDHDSSFWLYVQNKNPISGVVEQKRIWVTPYDGYLFTSGYYYSAEEKVRENIEVLVEAYKSNKKQVFDEVNALNSVDPYYPFILNATTGKIEAHGAFISRIGIDSIILNDGTERLSTDILDDLYKYNSTWTDYKFTNPSTGELEHKRTYLYLHDGYVFGAGFYYSVFGSTAR